MFRWSLDRHIVDPHEGGDGLLPAIGPLGAELVIAQTAHNAGGLHLPHGLAGPGGDGAIVVKGGGSLAQIDAQHPRQPGEDGGGLLSCQPAVRVKSFRPHAGDYPQRPSPAPRGCWYR